MDEFSSFASAPSSNNFSDDPTADFLAREQAALGGDADFLAGLSSPTASAPVSGGVAADDFESNFPSVDNYALSSATNNVAKDDDFGAFHNDFPDIEPIQSSQPTFGVPVQATGASPMFSSNSPVVQSSQRQQTPVIAKQPEFVPEVIREWRNKQQAAIEERDARSEEKRLATVGNAHEAIDRFYEDYNQKKAKSISENKIKEDAFLAKQNDVASGTQWERINQHLDNSPAAIAAAQKAGRRDTSRMRELLRDLQKDANAPGQ